MKTKLFALLISSLLFLFSYAQEDLTLEQVLQNYYQAIGTEKLKNVNTIVQYGHLDLGGNTLNRTTYIKRPDKIRSETNYMGNKIIMTFDGQQGWMINPMTGTNEPQPMDSITVANIKDQINFEGLLYNYKDHGYTAQLEGIEDVNGTDAYVIHLHKPKRDIWFYLDAETFIPIQQKSESTIKGRKITSTYTFSNYKQINGIAFPFLTTIIGGPMGQMQAVADSIKLNVPLPDSLFTIKPTEKQ